MEYKEPSEILNLLGIEDYIGEDELYDICKRKNLAFDQGFLLDAAIDCLRTESTRVSRRNGEYRWEQIAVQINQYYSALKAEIHTDKFWRSNIERKIANNSRGIFEENAKDVLRILDNENPHAEDYVADVAQAILKGKRIKPKLAHEYLFAPFNLNESRKKSLYQELRNIPSCEGIFPKGGCIPEGVVSVTLQKWYVTTFERKTGVKLPPPEDRLILKSSLAQKAYEEVLKGE